MDLLFSNTKNMINHALHHGVVFFLPKFGYFFKPLQIQNMRKTEKFGDNQNRIRMKNKQIGSGWSWKFEISDRPVIR